MAVDRSAFFLFLLICVGGRNMGKREAMHGGYIYTTQDVQVVATVYARTKPQCQKGPTCIPIYPGVCARVMQMQKYQPVLRFGAWAA